MHFQGCRKTKNLGLDLVYTTLLSVIIFLWSCNASNEADQSSLAKDFEQIYNPGAPSEPELGEGYEARILSNGENKLLNGKRFSSFRTDLGKRHKMRYDAEPAQMEEIRNEEQTKRLSPFRSDLGKRPDEKEPVSESDQPNQHVDDDRVYESESGSLPMSSPEEKKTVAFRADLGKRFDDKRNVKKFSSSFRGDLGKRTRRMKRAFRTDLGKRNSYSDNDGGDDDDLEVERRAARNAFRGDLGKRILSLRSVFGTGKDEKKYYKFRGDLGKRSGFRTDLGKKRIFRTDLGKRSRFEDGDALETFNDISNPESLEDFRNSDISYDDELDFEKRLFRTDLGK